MTDPLYLRLAEVVRHNPDCPGLGKADEFCRCDAVAALRAAKERLEGEGGDPLHTVSITVSLTSDVPGLVDVAAGFLKKLQAMK